MSRQAAYAAAARVYSFEEISLSKEEAIAFLRENAQRFTDDEWQGMIEMGVLPVAEDAGEDDAKMVFAAYDPTRTGMMRLLRKLGHSRNELRYAPESLLSELIDDGLARKEALEPKNEYLERVRGDTLAFDLGTDKSQDAAFVDNEKLAAEISSSALINLFEAMLIEAVREGVSDIHVFPNAEQHITIFFRIDGELQEWHTERRVHPEAFLAVVKDNATNIDRFERDDAQDGFIQRRIDDVMIRFRVSVLPIANAQQDIHAESIVIRVLDDRNVIADLEKLGLDALALERFNHAIRQPYGMVILTGPTGSGKTTTLYAALQQVVAPRVNVLTVEDPVEYILPGVRQIKLNHKLGIERALRAILRHDPDIVMVGEMRDRHTAELGIKLANTGHLTFSTLHTNDAPSAVSRLYKMGIEPFLLAYSINLVVAQRLIRMLCPDCKQECADLDAALLKRIGFSDEEIEATAFYDAPEGGGCAACSGVGYAGRRAITETMPFSPEIRHIIVTSGEAVDEARLRDQALEEGMLTLQASAREAVKRGETSVKEMMRVVFTQ